MHIYIYTYICVSKTCVETAKARLAVACLHQCIMQAGAAAHVVA